MISPAHNNALSSDQLLQKLATFGGWPVLLGKNWNSSNFNWINATLKISEIGFPPSYIATVRQIVDTGNSSRYMMAVSIYFHDKKLCKKKQSPNRLDLQQIKFINAFELQNQCRFFSAFPVEILQKISLLEEQLLTIEIEPLALRQILIPFSDY